MRKFVAALAATVVMLLSLVPAPAQAEQGCIINVVGIKVCGKLLEPLPTVTIKPDPIVVPGPTVTVKPDPLPPVTETVRPQPLPAETVTVRPPSSTDTVREPSETRTVREPRATVTRTEAPAPRATRTVTETPSSESGGRQVTPSDDRMDDEETPDFFSYDLDLGDDKATAAEIGVGTLTLLALVGLLLLAMYAGYILGYKDKERKDTNFMRALLETAKPYRGNHS